MLPTTAETFFQIQNHASQGGTKTPSSLPPGPCRTLLKVLLLNTNHVFPCCAHLCILACGTVPAVWQEFEETWPTQSRLDGGLTGRRIYFRPKHWDGVDELETVERRYESGFPGLRIQRTILNKQGHCWPRASEILGPKARDRLPPTY